MNDLHDAYNNLQNREIRIRTFVWWQLRFVMNLDVILQNSPSLMIGKMNGGVSLARICSNYEKFQFTIVEHTLDSCESWGFGSCFVKTVEEEVEWRLDQQEFPNFIKNWKSFCGFCVMCSWMFLRKCERIGEFSDLNFGEMKFCYD